MPGTTPNLHLPYPSPPDPADVPADIQALAMALDALAPGGSFTRAPTRRIIAAGSGNYSPPAGCKAIYVECLGGGGGGGGSRDTGAGQYSCATGGTGGSYGARLIANPSGSYAYSVGAGGTAGPAGSGGAGGAGGNGGDTTFGAGGSQVVGKGGAGGGGASVGNPPGMAGGVQAPGGSVGDVTIQGGPSDYGFVLSAAVLTSGAGGEGAVFGTRTVGRWSSGSNNGIGYGGGASGGITPGGSGAGYPGGVGVPGLIVITEY